MRFYRSLGIILRSNQQKETFFNMTTNKICFFLVLFCFIIVCTRYSAMELSFNFRDFKDFREFEFTLKTIPVSDRIIIF
jgi:hypothetical protein